MAHPVLPLLLAVTYGCLPKVDLHAQSKDPLACLKMNPGIILIADSHAGDDPDGPDPHGSDPHDENHDGGLPANSHDNSAPTDPYGGAAPNSRQPYLPPPGTPYN